MSLELHLSRYGLVPRQLDGLIGIFTYPFIHGSWEHLIDNSVPLFVLLLGLVYFYGRLSISVVAWSWLMGAVWMWVAARDGFHIGASGVIYSLATFICISGFIRNYYRLIALSLIVVFLYGSMIWGVLPIEPQVSWEGHLFGAIAGGLLAFYYKGEGPQKPRYSWEYEEEDDDEWEEPQEENPHRVTITYTYKQSDPTKSDQSNSTD